MTPPRAALFWSSGKDSTFALMEARRLGLARIEVLVTTVREDGAVPSHGTDPGLLERQAEALGLEMITVPLPSPCPNTEYEARTGRVAGALKARGLTHVVFGDLFLADIRRYREGQAAGWGMEPLFPLWDRDTTALAREMIASGLDARICALDPARVPERFAGARFDAAFLEALPEGTDPCGENGEFHTVVVDAPVFAKPIPVRVGEAERSEAMVFAPILPG